jgi:hypothetical protein
MLDMLVKMAPLAGVAAAEETAPAVNPVLRGIAYVMVVAAGLGIGAIAGFVLGVYSGLIRFELC